MKVKIEDVEYTIKSKQAVEILDLIEKHRINEKLKPFKDFIKNSNVDDTFSMAKIGSETYVLACKVIAIATGSLSNGTINENYTLVDEIEAMKIPMYAFAIFQSLLVPISYVVTDDTLQEEKKTSINEKEKDSEEKSGTLENPSEQKVT